MQFPENTIIDYFGSNEMSLGTVVKVSGERLHVQGATPQINKISPRQVLATYGDAGKNPLNQLAAMQLQIQETMAEIDLELLWEELQPQANQTLPLEEITNTYFTKATSLQLSAMARKLIEDKLHFQRQGKEFLVRSVEGVKELENLLRQRAERAALKERQRAWLQDVLTGNKTIPVPVPEEMEQIVQHSQDYLLNGFNSDTINLLSAVNAKQSTRETALKLLRLTDRLPEDADEFLLVNGIHAGFSKEAMKHASEIPELAELPDEMQKRLDLTEEFAFSIDDEWTHEIDDALSFRKEADRLLVGIHLAAPSCFVQKGDILDDAAVERPLSLYLPTTTVTMFPPDVSCRLASLDEGKLRPTMSFQVEFSTDGEIIDWRLSSAQIRVQKHLTYLEADQMLTNGSDAPLASTLRELQRLADILQSSREEAGGVNLNRPELKIMVRQGKITVTEDDQETPSHYLVREFMILANHLAAKYALRHQIPVIYRAQDPPSEPVTTMTCYDPLEFDQMVRKMKKTRLSTYPQAHAGLGLDLYTQVSSPIRRYADLVIQRQLAAHLENQPPPYTQEELFAVLDNVEQTTMQNRSLEREAKRFWLLEYLRREYMDCPLDATIVRLDGSLVLAELNRFYERGVVMTRERLQTGEKIQVRILEINPKGGRMALEIINRK
ncbi:MAG: RNB domain-containing ribonuclease [Lentisphaerae bacterium]|nr:RNB domain-containing ribonuclease [Lentisphaerota bacterium]